MIKKEKARLIRTPQFHLTTLNYNKLVHYTYTHTHTHNTIYDKKKFSTPPNTIQPDNRLINPSIKSHIISQFVLTILQTAIRSFQQFTTLLSIFPFPEVLVKGVCAYETRRIQCIFMGSGAREFIRVASSRSSRSHDVICNASVALLRLPV